MTHGRTIPALALALAALSRHPAPAAQQAPGDATELDAAERAWVASRVYRAVELHFGHWDDVPDLDLDAAWREALREAMEAPDRRGFSLAMQRFVAGLGNSHTAYSDRALLDDAGPAHGYGIRPIGDDWVVTWSRRAGLRPGDAIANVDGEPIGTFFRRKRVYLNASTERYARRRIYFRNQRHLWPRAYTLGLADGRSVRIEGEPAPSEAEPRPTVEGRWLDPGRIAYIRAGSWDRGEYVERAMEFLAEYRDAPALIVDVRGNGGGTTPVAFMAALMDRPWRWYAEASPMRIAVFGDKADRGQPGWSDFRRPTMAWPASVEKPDSVYLGRLVILVDAGCHSACEDFAMPFRDNGRALLVGEETAGSSGQPYFEDLGDGMRLMVGMKREFFPDGSPFEGVGIAPDLRVLPTAADIREDRDPELAAAVSRLREGLDGSGGG